MRKSILIVDDMEINRVILAEVFKDEFNILEAENGLQAIEIINSEPEPDIAAVLLDLIMPVMDGMKVMEELNRSGKINRLPVFIITAADSEQLLIDAYNLGAADVISKPFNTNFTKSRIDNITELYRHRNDLEAVVAEQVKHINSLNQAMVDTLASIIEFRDLESGEHVKRIRSITDILMTAVSNTYPEYCMERASIDKVVTASVLHDVGKIAIPDSILLKPGRLTKDEFEIMKLHTVRGCEILDKIPDMMDKETFTYVYDICRHHHERWDGKGYPDGLRGDEISIWAQVVSVADVYDALTSPRVYKAAFEDETAINMINNGECGTFNPKVLDAFNSSIEEIKAVHKYELSK